jgi:hypothetical protein
MGRASGKSFRKRHKLALQSIALIAMLIVPVALYWAAQAESMAGILAGMAVLGASMALAMAVS